MVGRDQRYAWDDVKGTCGTVHWCDVWISLGSSLKCFPDTNVRQKSLAAGHFSCSVQRVWSMTTHANATNGH